MLSGVDSTPTRAPTISVLTGSQTVGMDSALAHGPDGTNVVLQRAHHVGMDTTADLPRADALPRTLPPAYPDGTISDVALPGRPRRHPDRRRAKAAARPLTVIPPRAELTSGRRLPSTFGRHSRASSPAIGPTSDIRAGRSTCGRQTFSWSTVARRRALPRPSPTASGNPTAPRGKLHTTSGLPASTPRISPSRLWMSSIHRTETHSETDSSTSTDARAPPLQVNRDARS